MKSNQIYRIVIILFSCVLFGACSSGGDLDDLLNKQTANTTNSDDNNNNNQNTAANNEISASEASLSFTADGGSKSISVTSNFSWETISKPSWITISPSSGSKGTTNLTVTASKSASTTSRAGTISFGKSSSATTSISVSQAAASSSGGGSSSGSDKTFKVTGNGKTVTFKMIYVQGGTFTMGTSDSSMPDSRPSHTVTLSNNYYIGETEVTQALWYAVMGYSPSKEYGGRKWSSDKGLGGEYPAYNITYDDCLDFITKLNNLTGEKFRLPSEAEWEFAARGGNNSRGYYYSGSNTIEDVSWYKNNSNSQTHPVKMKKSNELAIYDMSGNVGEFCYGWDVRYTQDSQIDPVNPSSGTCHMTRGGSVFDVALGSRVEIRFFHLPSVWNYFLGLRLAL